LAVASRNGDSYYCFCPQWLLSSLAGNSLLTTWLLWSSFYNFDMNHIQNIISNSSSIVVFVFNAAGTCLLSCCLATDIFSCSTILTFEYHVTIVKMGLNETGWEYVIGFN
jgi:hypothetical protein